MKVSTEARRVQKTLLDT